MKKITITVDPEVLMAVLREAGPKSLESRIVYAQMLAALTAETMEYLEMLLSVRRMHGDECACHICRCAHPFVDAEKTEVSA